MIRLSWVQGGYHTRRVAGANRVTTYQSATLRAPAAVSGCNELIIELASHGFTLVKHHLFVARSDTHLVSDNGDVSHESAYYLGGKLTFRRGYVFLSVDVGNGNKLLDSPQKTLHHAVFTAGMLWWDFPCVPAGKGQRKAVTALALELMRACDGVQQWYRHIRVEFARRRNVSSGSWRQNTAWATFSRDDLMGIKPIEADTLRKSERLYRMELSRIPVDPDGRTLRPFRHFPAGSDVAGIEKWLGEVFGRKP